VRQRGSHKQVRHAAGRGKTVAVHAGNDMGPLMLHLIAADIELTAKEFLAVGD
jgi:predicted RNA binding protein YcfA (HicA-like mRNA interferase family)